MEKREIGIIGSGGQAKETSGYLKNLGIETSFYAVNSEFISGTEKKINLLDPTDYERITPVVAAIGAPELRKKLIESWPGEHYAAVVSTESYIGENVQVGEGTIIAPRAVLTAEIELGMHVIINVAATVSHNSKIGNYVTVSPGVHIAGNVQIGEGAFIGIGAIISNGVKIESGVVIGAGAVVINDITEKNAVYVGNPARMIKVNEGWLNEV